jgi:hypothetical protein
VALLLARRLAPTLAILLLLTALAASAAMAAGAAPEGTHASQDDEPADPAGELGSIEQATAELGRKRIRAVEHRPQRALYVAAARKLLADMRTLLEVQQPRIEAYGPAFDRYVSLLKAIDVSSPLVTAAIAAHGRRLAAHRAVGAIAANCAVFNRLAGAVREFPTRSAAQIVRADYRATPVARRIQRHVANRLTAIDRRHGISHRDARELEDAAEEMVAAGGSPGAALGFQYALSLR